MPTRPRVTRICEWFVLDSSVSLSFFNLCLSSRGTAARTFAGKFFELIDALAGHSFFTPVYRNEVAAFAGALQVEMMGGIGRV